MSKLPRTLPVMACSFLLVITTLLIPGQSLIFAKETSQDQGAQAKKRPVIFFDYSVVDDHDELLVLADEPLKGFKIFRMEAPPRLVLDVPGVSLLENVVGLPVNRPELSRIRIARHPDKVRFVFDLTEQVPVHHKVVKLDKGIKVVLTPKNTRQKTPSPQPEAAPQAAPKEAPLTVAPTSEPKGEAAEPTGSEVLSQTQINRLFGSQRVTILFNKASAKEFFAYVAEKSNTRIVVSPEVTESISLRLTDVTLGEAVTAVVRHLDLVLTREKNQISVRYALPAKPVGADSI